MKKPRHPKVAAWVQMLMRASGERSQEALAERLEVSRSGLAKWLYGDQKPQFDESQKLEAFAAELGVPRFSLFDPAAVPMAPRTAVSEARAAYVIKHKETLTVAEELDSIADASTRRRARNAALTAIEEALRVPSAADGPPQSGPPASRQGSSR